MRPHRAGWIKWFACLAVCVFLLACGVRSGASQELAAPEAQADHLADYPLTGSVAPIHDPSIIRSGNTYYLFSTDSGRRRTLGILPIRCSEDEVNWTLCGGVFQEIPAWVQGAIPGVAGLWAPDVTYWGGLYRVYYAGSTLGSQRSVIGVASNVTLDPADPRYKWKDGGEVLESRPGEDFNAIDPNVLLDTDGRIWMAYGSFWSGIKQIELDPATGKVKAKAKRYDLATRPDEVHDAIEGASMVKHNGYYYLFVSIDYCCNRDPTTNNYKEAVGRSKSPHGPFADASGRRMMKGGGTVLLDHDATWNAAGGGTAYVDGETGESLFVFHALKMTENAAPYVWLKHIRWLNDWPVLE